MIMGFESWDPFDSGKTEDKKGVEHAKGKEENNEKVGGKGESQQELLRNEKAKIEKKESAQKQGEGDPRNLLTNEGSSEWPPKNQRASNQEQVRALSERRNQIVESMKVSPSQELQKQLTDIQAQIVEAQKGGSQNTTAEQVGKKGVEKPRSFFSRLFQKQKAPEAPPTAQAEGEKNESRGFFGNIAAQNVGVAQQVMSGSAQQVVNPAQQVADGIEKGKGEFYITQQEVNSNNYNRYINSLREAGVSPARIAVLQSALSDVGTNHKWQDYMNDIKYNWAQTTPDWCGGFTGSQMAKGGVDSCKTFNGVGLERAKNWLNMGPTIALEDAKPGDPVICDRGSSTSPTGHIGIYVGNFNGKPYMVDGNMSARGVDLTPIPMTGTWEGISNPRFVRVLA